MYIFLEIFFMLVYFVTALYITALQELRYVSLFQHALYSILFVIFYILYIDHMVVFMFMFVCEMIFYFPAVD